MKTIAGCFLDILDSVVFKLFYASFIFHISILIYCLCFKWKLQSIWDLHWYIPRIRTYIGCSIGAFSVILCFTAIDSADDIQEAYFKVLFSCALSTLAAVLVYGRYGKPNPKVCLIISAYSIMNIITSCLEYILYPGFVGNADLRMVAAMYHYVIGNVLLKRSERL